MKRIVISFAAVVVVVPLSALSEEMCRPGTLQGQYIFTGRGFIEAVEPGYSACTTAS